MADADEEVELRWDELPLDLRLLKAVKKLGLGPPTPIQAKCIPFTLQGKDVLARAPTGSGKTYAYAIPLLQQVLRRHDGGSSSASPGVGAVVLVPTRELCQQVHGVLRKLLGHAGTAGIRVVALAAAGDRSALSTEAPPDAIIATPARLRQLIEDGGGGLQLRQSVHLLVVDEADLLLSYGYGDDIAVIGAALPQAVQTLLLSATISVRLLPAPNPTKARSASRMQRSPPAHCVRDCSPGGRRTVCPTVCPSQVNSSQARACLPSHLPPDGVLLAA